MSSPPGSAFGARGCPAPGASRQGKQAFRSSSEESQPSCRAQRVLTRSGAALPSSRSPQGVDPALALGAPTLAWGRPKSPQSSLTPNPPQRVPPLRGPLLPAHDAARRRRPAHKMAAERQGGRGGAGGGAEENKENERPPGARAGSLGDSLGLESILRGEERGWGWRRGRTGDGGRGRPGPGLVGGRGAGSFAFLSLVLCSSCGSVPCLCSLFPATWQPARWKSVCFERRQAVGFGGNVNRSELGRVRAGGLLAALRLCQRNCVTALAVGVACCSWGRR
ncbi:hypothetical protein LUU34_00267100 [Aix galericulata]|nr:hypothetical protein LUU34_00267100 [Aix galericulata]